MHYNWLQKYNEKFQFIMDELHQGKENSDMGLSATKLLIKISLMSHNQKPEICLLHWGKYTNSLRDLDEDSKILKLYMI